MQKPDKSLITVGVMGQGQLGTLSSLALQRRGLNVLLYQGDFQDQEAIAAFCHKCDVVTTENEFIPCELLKTVLSGTKTQLIPSRGAYKIFQHKALEKRLAQKAKISVVPWIEVMDLSDVKRFLSLHQRIILKTCRGGYDGFGNLSVTAATSDESIERFLQRGDCLAEAFVDFEYEVAVVVARGAHNTVTFPVAHTVQENHICHYVITPTPLSNAIVREVTSSAIRLVDASKGIGLFGVEFFITRTGQVIYNETAPRPHNSAHFTIDGCTLSQFDMLAKIILDEELPAPELLGPAVGMLNLLGTRHGPAHFEPRDLFENWPQGKLCLYNKPDSRPGRKMGHFNLIGSSPATIMDTLQDLKRRYQL